MYQHVKLHDGRFFYPVDAATGDPIPHVRWANTDTGELGRYQVDDDGMVQMGEDGELLVLAEKHDFILKDSRVDPFPEGWNAPPMRKISYPSEQAIQRASDAAWHR